MILGVIEMKDMAYGVSFMLLAQLLNITMRLSIGGAVFTNTALKQLRPLLPDIPDNKLQESLAGATGDFLTHLSEETRQAVLRASIGSINNA